MEEITRQQKLKQRMAKIEVDLVYLNNITATNIICKKEIIELLEVEHKYITLKLWYDEVYIAIVDAYPNN